MVKKLFLLMAFVVTTNLFSMDIAIIQAVRDCNKTNVESLIKCGANVNIQDEHGCTALFEACETNQILIVEALIKAGAHVDIQDINGNTALMCAEHYGHKEIKKLLIKAGANKNLKNNDGKTAHDLASEYRRKKFKNFMTKLRHPIRSYFGMPMLG